MSHRYLGNKLLLLSLSLNFSCSSLYKGNDKINDKKTLYPDKNNIDLENKDFPFKLQIAKKDLNRTLFVNIKIQNPNTTNRTVEVFSEIFEKKLKSEGCDKKKDLLTISVDHDQQGEITKKFIDDEVVKIKQKLVDQKYKKIFNNVIVSVIYDGGMRTLAQNIIKNLTGNCFAHEICCNPNEQSFDATVDVQKQIENYNNSPKNFNLLDKSEVLDVDEINKVVKDVVDGFFIQS